MANNIRTTPVLVPLHATGEKLGGIGKMAVDELVAEGHLVKVHIKRRAFITADSIDAYVRGLIAAATAR